MGLAKNDLINCEERGFGHCEKVVCRDCVGNKSLQKHIATHGYMSTCDYCGKRRKVVTVEELINPIMSGIHFEYENADNYYFDGSLPNCVSTYELIHYEIADDLQIDNIELLDDISDTIDDVNWCAVNPYSEKEHEVELYSWHSFCKLAKEQVRYVFYRSKNVYSDSDLSNPVNILDTVAEYVQKFGLVKRIPVNTKIYRGRTHNRENEIVDISEFGPPPTQFAKSNRMSAEGISLFYAAYNEETVLSEIACKDEYATVASFKTIRPLTIIDFSKLRKQKMPSIFDEDNRAKRAPLIFLKSFAEDVCKKIDNIPSIEYVPTQIVTEYFRYVFSSDVYGDVDGIVYNSAQSTNGYCIVLFMNEAGFKDNKQCMIDKSSFKLSQYQKKYVVDK